MELTTDEQIIVAIRQITQAIDLWSRQLWQQAGLTSPQLAVLREIQSGRNATPTTIADALHLTQPTVTGILQRLDRIGAVRRERSDEDRRSIRAVLTPKGESLVAKCPSLLRDRVRERLARVPKVQLKQLLIDVQLLAKMMGVPMLDESPFLFSACTLLRNGERKRRTRARSV